MNMRYIDDFTCYRLNIRLRLRDSGEYFNILNYKIQIPTPFVIGGVVAGTSAALAVLK